MWPIANAALPTEGIRSYLYQRSPEHRHRGIDLAAKRGAPVRATAPGVVTHAVRKWQQGFTGYGRAVVIKHPGGAHTLYAHLQSVTVLAGQHVDAGEVIGTVGGSQFSKAGGYVDEALSPHLHFEAASRAYPMPSEAERIDPVAWLRGSARGEEVLQAAKQDSSSSALIAFALGVAAWIMLRKKS